MTSSQILIDAFEKEKSMKYDGGIFEKTQIDFSYNSNCIEGSHLSKDHTRELFQTKSIIARNNEQIFSDDIICANNHFRAFDYVIEHCQEPLTERWIKKIHKILMTATSVENNGFPIGEYKSQENIVGDMETILPGMVPEAMKKLISEYHKKSSVALADIVKFHHAFESIHPFQDGNGRTGRLILFKECLCHNLVPLIIEDKNKAFYYRGLQEFKREPGYLLETCGLEQDVYTLICCQLVRGYKEALRAENQLPPQIARILEKREIHRDESVFSRE